MEAAPTGCYKCGRPGHWSRDCPDSQTNPKPTSDSNPNPNPRPFPSSRPGQNLNPKPVLEKPKKVPITRPKLTPELLLGDEGLGYVLRHFPRNFKYHGRAHEVSDLGNLISLYREWHSRMLPYLSFDQFVHKVEQVAASKRVKTCINELREKIARGENLATCQESCENMGPNVEQDSAEAINHEGQQESGDQGLRNFDVDVDQEDMLREVYARSIDGSPKTANFDVETPNKGCGATCTSVDITPEQKARMEENRLKALERAAARARG